MSYTDADVKALADMMVNPRLIGSKVAYQMARDVLDHLTAAGWAKRADVELEHLRALRSALRGAVSDQLMADLDAYEVKLLRETRQ